MWALVENNAVTKVFRNAQPFELNDVQYPSSVFTIWTNDDRNQLGIYSVTTDTYPNIREVSVIGSTFEFDALNKVVLEHYTTVALDQSMIDMNFQNDMVTAVTSIDNQAENERLKYITGGSGQAMTYQEKYSQSLAVVAAHTAGTAIDSTVNALVFAEVGITAPETGDNDADMLAVAQVIIAQYEAWKYIGGQIEKVRLQAKKDLKNCKTYVDIANLMASITWPTLPS